MTKIIIKGNYSQIVGENDLEHLLALDKHLSFFVLGAEYTAAYRGFINDKGEYVKWDGFKKLLNPSGIFCTGLLNRVMSFYNDNNKTFELIDARPPKSIGTPINILEKLKKLNKEPYPYQLDVLNVIDKYDRGIIKMATGAGKSLVAALITAKLGKKTIIYVIGKDLLYQFYNFFSEVFDEEIGIIGDGQCIIKNINIVSIWTAGQALGINKKNILLDSDFDEKETSHTKYDSIKKLLKDAKVHIIDECHMAACETIQQIYKNTNAEHLYGLSGSPWRDDGQDLLIESILGNYIVNISASYLIKNQFLAQPIILFRAVPPYPYELNKVYQSVYRKYIVENYERNKIILEAAQTMIKKGYQTLVLFNSLKHGKILYKLLSKHLNCVLLDGSNDQETRNKVKQDLLDNKIDCIIASRIYDIGVDIPSLSGLIVACGGKSSVKALQRVGRVIRKYKDKKFAVIIDFIDQAPFLFEHSKTRYRIYRSEDGFDVKIPKSIKWKKK